MESLSGALGLSRVRADSLELSFIAAKGTNKSYFAHVHEVESGLNGFFFLPQEGKKLNIVF